MIILKTQSKWRWIIAGYLFLAGLGAGAYITGVISGWIGGEWAALSKIGVALGFPCVAVGCGLLILDLGKPINFWRAAMRPNTSWMARGTIIISTFMFLSVIHLAFWIWPFANTLAEGARNVIGAPEFARMKQRPILINCGRGGLVDEAALVNALDEGQIAGAGIDCLTAEPPDPTNPLLKVLDRRNVIVTPHTAWASDEARGIVWDQVIEQIENYHRGEPGNRVV